MKTHRMIGSLEPVFLGTVFLLAGAVAVSAHPGHGLFDDGPRHAFGQVDHLLTLGLIGLLLFRLAFVAKSIKARRALQFAGVTTAVVGVILQTC